MKRLVIFTLAFLTLSCAAALFGTKYKYTFVLVKPAESTALRFDDDILDIQFYISDKAINFTLRNKTEDVIKILWDEATVVQYGKAQKVMHSGVKYIDRNQAQTPTVIPSRSSVDDLAIPTDNIYFTSGRYGGWNEHDLFLTRDMNKQDTRNLILSSKGQSISLYLPIQRQGKTLDYTFEFRISDVAQIPG